MYGGNPSLKTRYGWLFRFCLQQEPPQPPPGGFFMPDATATDSWLRASSTFSRFGRSPRNELLRMRATQRVDKEMEQDFI